jgi:hypothetical protein
MAHLPLDPDQLAALADDRLRRWAEAYGNSCNLPALAQVHAEQARRRTARPGVATVAA